MVQLYVHYLRVQYRLPSISRATERISYGAWSCGLHANGQSVRTQDPATSEHTQ